MTGLNGTRTTVGRPDATAHACAQECAPTRELIAALSRYRHLPTATGADRAAVDHLAGRLRRQVRDVYRKHELPAPELER